MNFIDIFRRLFGLGRQPGGETTRYLAFEVMMLAADLAGQDASAELEQSNTAAILQDARGFVKVARERSHELELQLAALRDENTLLRGAHATTPKPEHRSHAASQDPPMIARDLIEIADRLASQPDQPIIRWVASRAAQMMKQCEIYPIIDDGPVDPTRHEVVEVRAAADPRVADHIAETARPGYRWRDQILRPQQIIAYVKAGRP